MCGPNVTNGYELKLRRHLQTSDQLSCSPSAPDGRVDTGGGGVYLGRATRQVSHMATE